MKLACVVSILLTRVVCGRAPFRPHKAAAELVSVRESKSALASQRSPLAAESKCQNIGFLNFFLGSQCSDCVENDDGSFSRSCSWPCSQCWLDTENCFEITSDVYSFSDVLGEVNTQEDFTFTYLIDGSTVEGSLSSPADSTVTPTCDLIVDGTTCTSCSISSTGDVSIDCSNVIAGAICINCTGENSPDLIRFVLFKINSLVGDDDDDDEDFSILFSSKCPPQETCEDVFQLLDLADGCSCDPRDDGSVIGTCGEGEVARQDCLSCWDDTNECVELSDLGFIFTDDITSPFSIQTRVFRINGITASYVTDSAPDSTVTFELQFPADTNLTCALDINGESCDTCEYKEVDLETGAVPVLVDCTNVIDGALCSGCSMAEAPSILRYMIDGIYPVLRAFAVLGNDDAPPALRDSCAATGETGGDPHITTFDGLEFDCQASGEFILAKSDTTDFQVQARFESVSDTSLASVATGIAIAMPDKPTLEFTLPTGSSTSCDSSLEAFVMGTKTNPLLVAVDGVAVTEGSTSSGDLTINIAYDSGFEMNVIVRESSAFGCFLSYWMFMPESFSVDKEISGLLGTPDGDEENDWPSRFGVTRDIPVGLEAFFQVAYDYCTSNWCNRVEADSLFTFADGLTFDMFDNCNVPYDNAVELAVTGASAEIQDVCGGDFACLVDGVVGSKEDAEMYLVDKAEVTEATGDRLMANLPEPTPTNSPSPEPSAAPSPAPSPAPSSAPSSAPVVTIPDPPPCTFGFDIFGDSCNVRAFGRLIADIFRAIKRAFGLL